MKSKDKSLEHFLREKNTFCINRYTKISNVRYSLWHPIENAGSATSFSSEDAFPSVSFQLKNSGTFY